MWVSSAIGQLCCGLLTVLVATRIQQAANPTAYILGVLAFILGEFIVWYGYYDNSVFFLCAYAGGCIVGVGLGLMALSWGKLYSAIPFLPAETLIITAFLGAFVLYALILAFKLSGFVSLIFLVIFAICSIACFTAALKDCPSENTAAGAPVSVKTQLASFWQVFLIQTLLWMLFAFFRVISTPNTPGDRVLHFLIPFSVSAIIATAMLLLIRTFTRNFNISSAFRVGLPLYFFSCALLFFAPEHQTMRIIAYTINFVGMFIVQLTYWISILKFTGRKFLSPTIGFGFFITAEGLGILIGCGLGLVVKPCYTCGTLISIAILLGSIATTGIMAVVYSPRVAAGTAKTFASSADAAPGETISDASAPATEAQAQEILASLARERAHALA